jgi:molybdopterin converting factor small subunit
MRKFILTAVICAIAGAPVMAVAADKKEEQCQKTVTATLESLEASSEKEGKEVKLKDLSALDIMNMAKAKGVCAASEEINRRTK